MSAFDPKQARPDYSFSSFSDTEWGPLAHNQKAVNSSPFTAKQKTGASAASHCNHSDAINIASPIEVKEP